MIPSTYACPLKPMAIQWHHWFCFNRSKSKSSCFYSFWGQIPSQLFNYLAVFLCYLCSTAWDYAISVDPVRLIKLMVLNTFRREISEDQTFGKKNSVSKSVRYKEVCFICYWTFCTRKYLALFRNTIFSIVELINL